MLNVPTYQIYTLSFGPLYDENELVIQIISFLSRFILKFKYRLNINFDNIDMDFDDDGDDNLTYEIKFEHTYT